MKKAWNTPAFRRFGSVADLTLASEQENRGKCPGLEDDAETTWVPDRGVANDQALVSLVFLLQDGGEAAALAGERCDLPEEQWRARDTFRHLLETVAMLPFASVAADAIYVIPGGLDLAFSRRELESADYEHLLPVE